MSEEAIKEKIFSLVKELIKRRQEEFVPNKTPILTGLAVYDDKEINAMISSLLDGWFGLAERGKEFEEEFAKFMTTKHCLMVNSGSSANLIALHGVKIKSKLKGGEIITPACGFPTTINPIIQLGFIPAFIDIDETLNLDIEGIKTAINEKTRGIIFAHTLGNPCKIDEVMEIANENGIFVIEDCCDAYGSMFNNKKCGSFGIVSTSSFYPAHGITMGEGGAVCTNDSSLFAIMRSLRDWGRDCWCETGKDNTCGRRFEYKINGIPYDHKYIFSQIGYNMKPLEIQAAMGKVQLQKLGSFIEIRKRNFKIYQEELVNFLDYIELPEINEKAEPVFFGLPLIIKNQKIKRYDLLAFLNKNKIATRLLFAGNIIHQPAYNGITYKKYQDLKYCDKIMRDCFWLGIHSGINEEMIKYVISKFKEYFRNFN